MKWSSPENSFHARFPRPPEKLEFQALFPMPPENSLFQALFPTPPRTNPELRSWGPLWFPDKQERAVGSFGCPFRASVLPSYPISIFPSYCLTGFILFFCLIGFIGLLGNCFLRHSEQLSFWYLIWKVAFWHIGIHVWHPDDILNNFHFDT